jgi:DNA polymerase-3 subunit gamma/tau
VAHAILFTGPRGTGKTTIARIVAKAMNCQSGPTPTPCNACRSCLDITAGRGVDVFEIDGASNNSVDQVRELRESIRYMPAHSRFKIYIIDEVHMLSTAAFNALLKTLEEPPAHVMFLFATTEPNKIPITILSRCQRHDLRRIDANAIVAQMETLCQRESVSIDSGSLWTIAREADGSMRDALSLLDQVLACSDGEIDADDVNHMLGGLDRKVLFDLSEAVFARDISRILTVIDTVYRNGQDMKRFYTNVLMHFRHLLLIKMDARPDLLVDLASSEIERLDQQANAVSIAFIHQVFTVLFNAEAGIRQALHPRLAIEMAFFKIHQITPVLPIDQLIERMDALLRAPNLAAVPGIVEVQATYEKAEPIPPIEPASTPVLDRQGGPAETAPHHLDDLPVAATSDGPSDGDDIWGRINAVIAREKPSIAAAFSRSRLVSVSEDAFVVSVPDNGYAMKMIRKNLVMIDAICREHGGRTLQIAFTGDAAAGRPEATDRPTADDAEKELLNHPLVADAVDIFNGKLEAIKLR